MSENVQEAKILSDEEAKLKDGLENLVAQLRSWLLEHFRSFKSPYELS